MLAVAEVLGHVDGGGLVAFAGQVDAPGTRLFVGEQPGVRLFAEALLIPGGEGSQRGLIVRVGMAFIGGEKFSGLDNGSS